MQNYFHYFTEIEERFSRRRGSLLLLSTLDWALIESWREAGVPLEAVLRGIDSAFDRYESRSVRAKGHFRKVNGLAWCAQAVMAAAEELVEAATGAVPQRDSTSRPSGFENEHVMSYLKRNAHAVAAESERTSNEALSAVVARLRELAAGMSEADAMTLEELDHHLTVLEERMVEAVRARASEADLVGLRQQADSEIAPFRSRMTTVQLRQVQQQFLTRRLLQMHSLPRLSLFYMSVGE
jgi:phage terminase Nu1 subunit (DNA packaging protein)